MADDDEPQLRRLLEQHYPRVRAHLEDYRMRNPERWASRDAAVWQEIDRYVPDELVPEWAAFKGEFAGGLHLDPKRREVELEAVRRRARDALAQGESLGAGKRYLCETALQWPAAFLPWADPPFNQTAIEEARAYLREHPELSGADAETLARKLPERVVRSLGTLALVDDLHALFGWRNYEPPDA